MNLSMLLPGQQAAHCPHHRPVLPSQPFLQGPPDCRGLQTVQLQMILVHANADCLVTAGLQAQCRRCSSAERALLRLSGFVSRDWCGWTMWLHKLVLLPGAFNCSLHRRIMWPQCRVNSSPCRSCGPCAGLQLGPQLSAPSWFGLHLQQVSVSHAQLS